MTGDITVVIPNYNGGSRLKRTLESVARQTLDPRATIVVDDASTDGSPLDAERAGATVLRLDTNSGFSHAVNTGVAAASTDWVFILNNDAVLSPDCLATLLHACRHNNLPFAAPKLVSLRHPDQLDGSYDLLARSGCAWRAGHGLPDRSTAPASIPAQFLPLTATLIERELFVRVGCLEERFETYLEDVEFFLRCALLGHSGLYVPAAVAWHEGSATDGAWSARMVRLIARNQLLLVARHWPQDWLLRYGWPVLAGQLLWGLLAWRRGAGRAWLQGKWAGLRMFSTIRSSAVPADSARLESILHDSETRLRRLQAALGPERFWSAYFLCVPEARP